MHVATPRQGPEKDRALDGQVALVTGAGGGLGRRFAHVLAANGATVAVAGRRVEKLDHVVSEIEDLGGRALAVPLDVRDAQAIVDALDHIEERAGIPRVLVNNAGTVDARSATKMDLALVDDVIGTNLRGPWLLATGVGRRLIDAGLTGRIVNISSMGAFYTKGGGAALYSTTKAAINRMTEALAVEWAGHGINVNAIAPGSFRSEMLDAMVGRVGDFSKTFPRQRWCEPDRLDSTLLYLLSPQSDAVTGTVVKVDDGQLPR